MPSDLVRFKPYAHTVSLASDVADPMIDTFSGGAPLDEAADNDGDEVQVISRALGGYAYFIRIQ